MGKYAQNAPKILCKQLKCATEYFYELVMINYGFIHRKFFDSKNYVINSLSGEFRPLSCSIHPPDTPAGTELNLDLPLRSVGERQKMARRTRQAKGAKISSWQRLEGQKTRQNFRHFQFYFSPTLAEFSKIHRHFQNYQFSTNFATHTKLFLWTCPKFWSDRDKI